MHLVLDQFPVGMQMKMHMRVGSLHVVVMRMLAVLVMDMRVLADLVVEQRVLAMLMVEVRMLAMVVAGHALVAVGPCLVMGMRAMAPPFSAGVPVPGFVMGVVRSMLVGQVRGMAGMAGVTRMAGVTGFGYHGEETAEVDAAVEVDQFTEDTAGDQLMVASVGKWTSKRARGRGTARKMG